MSYQESLLYQITKRIRQSLDLAQVLNATVDEIRQFLAVDRVKIYRFMLDGSGEVTAESVNRDALPSLLNLRFPAADIPQAARERFVRQRQRVIVDVAAQRQVTTQATAFPSVERAVAPELHYDAVSPCHLTYLTEMGVAASLVLPILHQGELWGLLVAHHGTPHHFKQRHLQMLQLIVEQLEIAISQTQLLQQAQHQATQEAVISRVSQVLHYPLEPSQTRQAVLEILAAAVGASGGRLFLQGDEINPQGQLLTTGVQPTAEVWETLPIWSQLAKQGMAATAPNAESGGWSGYQNQIQQSIRHLQEANTPIRLQGVPLMYTLVDLQQQSQWQPLVEGLLPTPIRSLLILPLTFHHQCLGYLTLFRNGEEVQIDWAGRCDGDRRVLFPKLSFEVWRELRHQQPIPWLPAEIKLVQGVGLHLYMALLQRRLESLVRYRSSRDSLTQLPNRLLFSERLMFALMQMRQVDTILAVGVLDINRFKRINDDLGHEAGDELLTAITQRLQGCLPMADVLARWGSDEFSFWYPASNMGGIVALADELLERMNAPFLIAGKELFVTVSMGLALAPYDGTEADVLMRNANLALQKAQREGYHVYRLYQNLPSPTPIMPLTLEADLRRAIGSDQLQLYFQPQIDLQTGYLVGLEALIRWRHPEMGAISPGEFIPLAEETGLIWEIGKWALDTACRQQAIWQEAGLPLMPIAVNLSPRQFYRADLVQMVQETLHRHGVPPTSLELEITESAAMEDTDSAIRILRELRQMGIHIALDDFGTGYSSLTALKHFPLTTLKLDKSFIQDLMDNASDAAIAQTIVALGRGLGLRVLAEGVETTSQLHCLQQMQCHCAQGFLFSRPLPASDITRLIQQHCTLEGTQIRCRLWLMSQVDSP